MSHDQHKPKTIVRDISWLSFNARVLQEAGDQTVPLRERIRFLGIFSNNMDEFFRVRVATLRRMTMISGKANMHLEKDPQQILDDIQMTVLNQQSEFARIWDDVQKKLKGQKIFLVNENELTEEQMIFVRDYYDDEVSPNVNPLMIENIPRFPNLRDKSIYLAVVMWKKDSALKKKYALIEVPSRALGRFVLLPSKPGEHRIILLEDVIRCNLPEIFSYFGYDQYHSHIFKVTRDAELDIDSDISTNIIQKIEKGLKNRRKGKPVRFVYDREMDPGLLEYLTRRLNLTKKDNLIPGGRIHNFRHFMDFPNVFKPGKQRQKPFDHPLLTERRVSDVVLEKDIMLHLPYHSFTPLIDIIREAAIDPHVGTIKITCYRLASQSKIINALINAVRNGKEVVVMLELRARFDEEANLEWKSRLEEEGAKVILGIPDMKIHAKLCMIRKRVKDKNVIYGFVSTGNMNEKTSRVYGDHCLLTSNPRVMTDVSRIFNYLEHYRTGETHSLKNCQTIIPSPQIVRHELHKLIEEEIKSARKKKKAGITLKMNSLSDEDLIMKLTDAAKAGVEVRLIVRGIFCMITENKKFRVPVQAISIVDEYLEHARVWVFHNKGKQKVYISSADWMLRNLDHRVEATCPILDEGIKKELIDILEIQLKDNVKARWLDNELSNEYVKPGKTKVRSQVDIYQYLFNKTK
ncbi:polyphosphate kinase 1 [Terrimonas sp. NA20]|uniref:Polyphosphate kinase n=1 Tax=Terrimonas ginsenosidimutans TaxID=2908004 RepID=A0ABS9KW90_9BACT|nr:polyphosphate kinase 1 [Terrimonas ginsenosidimutans]MCG2616634.1 polyphosphate kinase 1 [Terrimonas ginsenosidimutans]